MNSESSTFTVIGSIEIRVLGAYFRGEDRSQTTAGTARPRVRAARGKPASPNIADAAFARGARSREHGSRCEPRRHLPER